MRQTTAIPIMARGVFVAHGEDLSPSSKPCVLSGPTMGLLIFSPETPAGAVPLRPTLGTGFKDRELAKQIPRLGQTSNHPSCMGEPHA